MKAFILFASFTIFLTLQAIYWVIVNRRNKKMAILEQRLGSADGDDAEINDGLFKEELENEFSKNLADLLRGAGDDDDLKAFYQKALIYGAIGCLAALLIFQNIELGLMGFIGGPLFLYFQLVKKRDARVDRIEQQLPEALEMMIISLRAGQSLEQTFNLNARELEAPIGDEFQRISDEMNVGRSMDDSLRAFSQRLKGAKTIRTFVVSALVLRQTGGNLIEVLEAIIDTMRQQAQYERKLKSMTAEGRSNARTLGALPPIFVTLSYLASPDYMSQILVHPIGQFMAGLSLTLYLVGFFWVRRLVTPRN